MKILPHRDNMLLVEEAEVVVETDKDGNLITKNGKEVVTSIVFEDQLLYPHNNNPI